MTSASGSASPVRPGASGRPVVVFIGAPGSGKSKIGRRVAKAMGLPFIDTDARVVAAHGAIDRLFADHGEPHFRALERAAVHEALGERAVVSLGGGAVLDPATQAELADLPVALLTIGADAVTGRIGDGRRPLVASLDDWQRLVEQRRPLYERLATRSWDTGAQPTDRLVAEIAAWAAERAGADDIAGAGGGAEA